MTNRESAFTKHDINDFHEYESVRKDGAKSILIEYDGAKLSALSFQYMVAANAIPFRLPCRWQALETVLRKSGKRPRSDDTFEGWARRVAWRQILRWIEAQMALVETSMVKIQEVFFPYICTQSGQTLYELQEHKGFLMLDSGQQTKQKE